MCLEEGNGLRGPTCSSVTSHRPIELMCTDFRTGAIVWSEPGFGSGGLMAAGKTVILSDQGILTLFEATAERDRPFTGRRS